MAEKSIIILDTNFIIEHISDLHELHQKLSENNIVYITEISINERISQKYLELKSKYEKIETFIKDYSAYATIKLKDTFSNRFEAEKQRTIDVYVKEFGDNIISFTPDVDALKIVMDRVYKKRAPFSNKERASDKGFKDTLIWMSIIQYFKEYKEDIGIIFITNDNGFLNSSDLLKLEFAEITGKTIEIKDNNYYKVLLGNQNPQEVTEEKSQQKLAEIDKQAIRDKIEKVIEAICYTETFDSWGNEWWEKTFTTNEKFDVEYIKLIFSSLKKDIDKHMFENQINAHSILDLDDRIKDLNPIPMQALEAANELYEDIQKRYPDFMEPFLNAVCNIMNKNYDIGNTPQSNDDELPF